jgi:hypothetical protein
MTSFNIYHGEKGNAQTENPGLLAESGFPGLIIYQFLISMVVFTTLRIIYQTKNVDLRFLKIIILLSLVTFYLHTIFYGSLEKDKSGSVYYGNLAAITVLDGYFFRRIT